MLPLAVFLVFAGCVWLVIAWGMANCRSRAGKRVVRLGMALGALLLLDIGLWSTGYASLGNRAVRLFSGAPHIQLADRTLEYDGIVSIEEATLRPVGVSREGIRLYSYAEPPPWYFVLIDAHTAYRYNFPRPLPKCC